MIHEFAVDPVSISNWSNFRAIIGNFGIEYGRLISRFPRRWERMVYDACNSCQDVKLKAIEEALARFKPKLVSMGREYDDSKDWFKNAEDQHTKRPFRAIITTDNPNAKEYVLVAEAIYNGMGEPWDIPREKLIERTPEALGDCALLLLKISKEILLIDPHFDPAKPRFLKTFRNIMKYALENIHPTRIELHIKHVDDYDTDKQEQIREWHELCLKKLPQCIQKGVHIKIIKWKQKDGGEKFHARYILTERGGIRYDVGLDEGHEGQTTDVMLLDRDLYEKRWKNYQRETAAFDLADEIEIEGSSE